MWGRQSLYLYYGVIPLTYGIYLLRLKPAEEPKLPFPKIFWRNIK